MPISWKCPHCGKGIKAGDAAAGKTASCPGCQQKIRVPVPKAIQEQAPKQDEDYQLQPLPKPEIRLPPAVSLPSSSLAAAARKVSDSPTPPRLQRAARPQKHDEVEYDQKPIRADIAPAWLRHLHWLLALALLPLVSSLFFKGPTTEERLVATFEELAGKEEKDQKPSDATDESQKTNDASGGNETKVGDGSETAEEEALPEVADEADASSPIDLEEMFKLLPGRKINGALLPRDTYLHWGLAAVSFTLYLTFVLLLAYKGTVTAIELAGAALFTATAGVFSLLLFQFIADFTQGFYLRGASIIVLIFWIIKLIGLSYHLADNPDTGFLLSFIGFTVGVGLCEEVCKCFPMFYRDLSKRGRDWHGLFLLGLASGVGFGVAEGIMYSSRYYNGFAEPNIYLIRFASCVALHAIWAGSVGIMYYFRQDNLSDEDGSANFFLELLYIIAVPMVLHGLYDTLLKKDMETWAVITAAASFVYLAGLIYYVQGEDIEVANEEMLEEYQRRRLVGR